jgi:iron complex outermembrane receptor protein
MLLLGLMFAARPGQAAHATDLTTLSLEQLLDITVVGASKYEQKQSEVAAAVSVITRAQIKAFGWRTLAEALASLPGVHLTNDRQYTYLGLRGFGLPGDLTARVLITINGNRVNDPVYDGGPAGRELPLDLGLVERIEFIPGPGGAVYGHNAMFGVVNVVTRQGAGLDGAEVELAAQHPQRLGEARASWGRHFDGGLDLLLSASGVRARGEDRFFDYGATGIAGVAAGLDAERDREIFVRAAAGRWSAEFVHGDRRKKDPTAAYFNDPLAPGYYFRDRYDLVQLQFQDTLAGDRVQVAGRLFAGRYRYESTFTYDGSLVAFPGAGDWHGTEWRLVTQAAAAHKLMLGLEAQDNRRTDQSVLDLADPTLNVDIPRSGYRVGVYVQDAWTLSDSVSATLGLRIDRNDKTGTTSSPRVGLIWQPQPSTTVKLLAGRAHRAPNAYERDYDDVYSQVRNPALTGERIDTQELVVDHRVGADLTLRASTYQWTMRDIVVLGVDPASGLTQYQSGETAKAHGLELSADRTWAQGARLRGSVSLQDVSYASGARLLNSPKLLGRVNLSSPLPWFGLHAGLELQYDAPRLTLDGTRLGGYALSNLHLRSESLAPGVELSLHVGNLFNKRHAQPGADTNWQNALEQDGRSLRLSLGLRF